MMCPLPFEPQSHVVGHTNNHTQQLRTYHNHSATTMMEPMANDMDDELSGSGATEGELDGSKACLLKDARRQEHMPPHAKAPYSTPPRHIPAPPLPAAAAAAAEPRSWYWPRTAPYLLLLAFGTLYIGGRPYLSPTHGSTTTANTSGTTGPLILMASFPVEGPNMVMSPLVLPAPPSSSFANGTTTLHRITPSTSSFSDDDDTPIPPFSAPFIPTEISDAVLGATGPPPSSSFTSLQENSSSPSAPASPSTSSSSSSSLSAAPSPPSYPSSPYSSSVSPSLHLSSTTPSSSSSSSSSIPLPFIPPPSTPLHIEASTVEYGAFSEETLRLYGWDLILEANGAITLRVLNPSPSPSMAAASSLTSSSPSSSQPSTTTASSTLLPDDASFSLPTYDWHVQQDDGAILLSVLDVGPVVTNVHCTHPGSSLSIHVTEYPSLRTFTTNAAVCKEVRREMRALTREDRQTYLESLNTFYRVPLEEGRARFGPRFANNPLLTSAHNSQTWCLHDPNQFLAVHSAFVYWGEQNMKRVSYVDTVRDGEGGDSWEEEDGKQLAPEAGLAAGAKQTSGSRPLGAIPYWDFHIDTQEYGAQWWWRNPFFQADDDEGFGPIDTSPAMGHVVEGSGKFARMPMVRGDQLPKEVHDAYDPGVDDFGLVTGSPFTLNGSPFVTRSGTVCGLPMALPMAPAQNLFDCYDKFDTWREATSCMYMQAHLQLHSHLGGGAWNCGVDLGAFHAAYPQYSPEILSFLGVSGRMVWSTLKTKNTRGLVRYRECDLKAGRCSCPALDAEGMPYPKLYRLLASALRRASRAWPGEFFVGPYGDTEELRFMRNDGTFFDWEDQESLLRMTARLWCEAAVDGHFVSMASINDPVFYAAHVYFDRLSHFLALSPAFADRGFNRTWSLVEGENEVKKQKTKVEEKGRGQQTDRRQKEEDEEGERHVGEEGGRRTRKLRGGDREGSGKQRDGSRSDTHDHGRGEMETASNDDDDTKHIHHHKTRHECLGGQYTDSSPFTPFLFMAVDKEKRLMEAPDEEDNDPDPHRYYIMSELDALMHPLHPSLPYVYDDLVHWGGEEWVPRAE